jgi:hypothetical protein
VLCGKKISKKIKKNRKNDLPVGKGQKIEKGKI